MHDDDEELEFDEEEEEHEVLVVRWLDFLIVLLAFVNELTTALDNLAGRITRLASGHANRDAANREMMAEVAVEIETLTGGRDAERR